MKFCKRLRNKKLKILAKYPSIILYSLVNSIKFGDFKEKYIISSKKTKIIRKKGANLKLNGLIFLGVYITRVGEIFRINKDYTIIEMGRNSYIDLGKNVSIGPGSSILLGKNSKLKIGDNTEITGGCKIIIEKEVEIGSNCMIAWDTQIMDTDWHVTMNNNGEYSNKIIIEDNVWIASGVKIMQGVTIGKGSVIAAGSIVNKDIPKNTLAGGIPVKIIKNDYYWEV